MEGDSSSIADITQCNELSLMTMGFNIGDSHPGDILEDGSRQSGTDNACSTDPQQFESIEMKYKLLDPSPACSETVLDKVVFLRTSTYQAIPI